MTNLDQQVEDQFGDMLFKAKENGGQAPTLPEGNHVVALFDFSRRTARSHGAFYSARYAIVKSTNPDCVEGSIYGDAFFVEKGDYAETNQARARNFIRAVCSLPDNVDGPTFKAALAEMLDKRNLARGVQIKAISVPRKSKRTGNEYAATQYEALPQDDKTIAKMREWIEGVEGDDPASDEPDTSFNTSALGQPANVAPQPAPQPAAAPPATRPFFSRG